MASMAGLTLVAQTGFSPLPFLFNRSDHRTDLSAFFCHKKTRKDPEQKKTPLIFHPIPNRENDLSKVSRAGSCGTWRRRPILWPANTRRPNASRPIIAS
jgi:hypothetical protein